MDRILFARMNFKMIKKNHTNRKSVIPRSCEGTVPFITHYHLRQGNTESLKRILLVAAHFMPETVIEIMDIEDEAGTLMQLPVSVGRF